MDVFLKKVFLFLVGIAVVVVSVVAIFYHSLHEFDLLKDKDSLIIGDSHTQSGLDDSIIVGSLNVSKSQQHFLYTYHVLSTLLKSNSKIDRVFLGVSFHSFSQNYDDNLFSGPLVEIMYPTYFPILGTESMCKLGLRPAGEVTAILKSMFVSVSGIFIGEAEYPFLGGYYRSTANNMSVRFTDAAVKRHYYTAAGDVSGFSNYQLEYLDKIVTLCNQRAVHLVFVHMPVHTSYLKRVPLKFVSRYYSEIGKYKGRVALLDLHSQKFSDTCYGDSDHLNSYGALQLSNQIQAMYKVTGN